MKSRVHWNIARQCWSRLTKGPKGWRLHCHDADIGLTNVRFVVSAAGWRRAVIEKQRNVHAFVEGDVGGEAAELQGDPVELRYSLAHGGFVPIMGSTHGGPLAVSAAYVQTVTPARLRAWNVVWR